MGFNSGFKGLIYQMCDIEFFYTNSISILVEGSLQYKK